MQAPVALWEEWVLSPGPPAPTPAVSPLNSQAAHKTTHSLQADYNTAVDNGGCVAGSMPVQLVDTALQPTSPACDCEWALHGTCQRGEGCLPQIGPPVCCSL